MSEVKVLYKLTVGIDVIDGTYQSKATPWVVVKDSNKVYIVRVQDDPIEDRTRHIKKASIDTIQEGNMNYSYVVWLTDTNKINGFVAQCNEKLKTLIDKRLEWATTASRELEKR